MNFLERFFGPGNHLRWSEITGGGLSPEHRERLQPFLAGAEADRDLTVLPCVREDGRVQWYALCRSERVARAVRDELRAFLGPSYSDFDGQPTRLDPSDPIENAVLERSGSNAFQLEIPGREFLKPARERLALLLRVHAERPIRVAPRARPAGRIVRDFEYALLTGDGDLATEYLAELRTGGYLDSTNLLFLEVRRLAALGAWSAILDLPDLGGLLQMRRPRRVTQALVRAVYHNELHAFAAAPYAAEAVAHFREAILPRFRSLYGSREGLTGFEADVSFLLAAAASEPPRPSLARSILDGLDPRAPGSDFLVAVGALITVPARHDDDDALQAARQAYLALDFDRAMALALQAPPSFERCSLLIRCAIDIDSLAAGREAVTAVRQLEPDLRRRVETHAVIGRQLSVLAGTVTDTGVPEPESLHAGDPPSSWPEWFARLRDESRWPGAVAFADKLAIEWRVEKLACDPDQVEQIANEVLEPRPPWGEAGFRDALPHFVRFLLGHDPDVRLRSIYENLTLVLAIDPDPSLPQVGAFLNLLEARLALRIDAREYGELISHASDMLKRVASPAALDVALDAIETLVVAPCADPAARAHFVVAVAAQFRRWYRRATPDQVAVFRALAEETGLPATDSLPDLAVADSEKQTKKESTWRALDGLSIALYSLREEAARRTAAALSQLVPAARVQVFDDKVGGSPALHTAASSADVFVLATSAAKHSATEFIQGRRPPGAATLFARGKGSASLLAALREYAGRIGSVA